MRALATFAVVAAVACSTTHPNLPAESPATAAATRASSGITPSFAYPPARRDGTVDHLHGTAVADPYRWLERMDAPDTRAWVAAENRQTDAYLAAIAGRDALRTRLAELQSQEQYTPPWRRGDRYFWAHFDGRQNQPLIERAATLDGTATVALDANRISTDGSRSLAGFTASRDGRLLAYGLAAGGGDWTTWRFRDVVSGRDLPDELTNIKYYRPVFTRDGSGVYYSRFPPPKPGAELTETDHDCKVYFHKLGTPASSDVVVYERTDHPTWQYDLRITSDGRYLIITIGDGQVGDRSQEQVVALDLTTSHPRPVALVDRFDAEYLFAGSDGPLFFFKSSLDAPNKRILAIDVRNPGRDRWRSIVPAGTEAIDEAHFGGGQLLVVRMKDAHSVVTAYDAHGKKLRDLKLPGIGRAGGFRGESDDREMFFFFTSITVPRSVYRYDIASGKVTPWRQRPAAFDATQIETKQIFFASKDGTQVPMFVTARKGLALDGSNATLMTGYGCGGIPFLPEFDPAMIAWIERGGVYVIVNIRGGGEYGEAWHLAASRSHRQTGYDDFIAAAEWLIAHRYTSPAHLGNIGTSGGGTLVAAVTVERPDLFGASVPISGVMDLLRFPLFGQGAGWQGDIGSPDDATDFASLYKISPLHNVRAGTRYPAMLVVTEDHDVRVAPLHSYKFVAALQAAQASPARVLLRVQTESGHGGGHMLSQRVDQDTEILSFLAHNLGLDLDGAPVNAGRSARP